MKKYVLKNSGDIQQAEDLFHDVVIKLIMKIRKNELEANTDVKAYLFTMAKNTWITKAKRESKMQLSSEMGAYDSQHSDEIKHDKNEKSILMESVLASLGEMCKDLLKLTFYMDMSLKEAAKKLGISNAEVAKTYQYRCKKKLFETIRKNQAFKELMQV